MPFCMCPLMDGVLLSSCLRERWSAVSNFLVNLTCGTSTLLILAA